MNYRMDEQEFSYPIESNTSPTRLDPITPIDRGRRPPRLVFSTPEQASIDKTNSPRPSSIISKSSNRYVPQRKQSEFVSGLKDFAKSGLSIGEKSTYWLYDKVSKLSKKWFTHCFLTIVLVIYTIGGALIFTAIEGSTEDVVVDDIWKARYSLISDLKEIADTVPKETSLGEWEPTAIRRLREFETFMKEHINNSTLISTNDGPKIWTFFNSVVYCGTIYTTIGYGHMYPTTITGMALTIVYAIIGIPLFLIALTDFGKLFTRGIKFMWSFVRRLYYTGSCRKVRKTAQVQDFLHGAQKVYQIATMRRPSMFSNAFNKSFDNDAENPKTPDGTINSTTPTTPAPSTFEIDDEFNLPISVAIFILVLYMFLGAVMYCTLEGWNFFAAFYFVFISMSTIGFGDYVPRDPICMIASVVYLVFGLALMSMCINVVQVKLSDTFKDASGKLGATIGIEVNEDDGSIATVTPSVIEVPNIHETIPSIKQNGSNIPNMEKKEKKSSMKFKGDNDMERDVEYDIYKRNKGDNF